MTNKAEYFALAKDLRPERKNDNLIILQAKEFSVEYRPGDKKVPLDATNFKPQSATDRAPQPKYFMHSGEDLIRFAILAVSGK